jgi:hypothetical protein
MICFINQLELILVKLKNLFQNEKLRFALLIKIHFIFAYFKKTAEQKEL